MCSSESFSLCVFHVCAYICVCEVEDLDGKKVSLPKLDKGRTKLFTICYVFISSETGCNGVLPDAGKYATGLLFLDRATASQAEETFTKFAEKYELQVGECVLDCCLFSKENVF